MHLDQTMAWMMVLLGALLPPILGLWLQPKLTAALLGDLRIPRILHFVALGGLGMALHLRGLGQERWANWPYLVLQFLLLIVCLSYAAVFAIVTNNLEDLEADRISNPGRPLVTGAVKLRPYLLAGILCEWWSLLLASAAGLPSNSQLEPQLKLLPGILAISAGYYVYSCRPFRWKRVPVLAKLLIGFNSWVIAVCGFALAGGDARDFPWIWSVFVLVPLSFAANFIDLKDIAGDRATGVGTLPVLIGERWARHIIAAATLATYAMGGILLDLWWAYPMNAVAATVHLVLLYRKPYDERPIFLVYVGALIGLDVLLVWP